MKHLKIFSAAVIAIALVACSKLNKDNYEKLSVGMEFNEVEAVIGSPDNCSETLGTKNCRWGDDTKYIKVTFVADKATLFSNNGLQ